MRAFGWFLVVGLVLAAAGCTEDGEDSDDDSDVPVGDCTNGVTDGDETDVDCGGGCDLGCGIAQACEGGDDCLFGACDDDACTAPDERPTATGPVTATLGPAGGVVTLVSAEGVTLELDVPAGALDAERSLTLTPRTPGAGQWVAVTVSGADLLLAEPATLTLTLPAGLSFTDDSTVVFADVDPAATTPPFPLATAHTAGSATVALRWIGVPATSTARDGQETVDLISQELALRELATLLQTRLDTVLSTESYEDHVAFLASVAASLARLGHPDYEALVLPIHAEIETTACTEMERLTALLGNSDRARCPWEVRERTENLMGWVAVGQRIGADCAVLTGNEWLAEVEAELASARSVAQTDEAEYRACECDKPGTAMPGCARDAAQDALWTRRVEGVDFNTESALRMDVLGHDGVGATVVTAYGTPFREALHEDAWTYCEEQGEQWVLGALSRAVDDGEPVLDDLQYCGTRLGLSVRDDQGDAIGAADAGGTGVGAYTSAASASAPAGGSLVLSGPLRALRCNPAGTDVDAIVVKRVADTTTEVARRTASGGFLLNADFALALDVDTLREGLAPDDDLVLEVWRETTACGGAYGPTEVNLFTVTATEPSLSARVLTTSWIGTRWIDHPSGNLCATPYPVSADAPVPTTVSNDCGSVAATFGAPNRLDLQWDGQGSPEAFVYPYVHFEVTLDRPGTLTATQAADATYATEGYGFSTGLYVDPAAPGVFGGAPRTYYADYVVMHYPSVVGVTPENSNVATQTWHSEAGTGRFRWGAGYAAATSSATLTLEFVPDP